MVPHARVEEREPCPEQATVQGGISVVDDADSTTLDRFLHLRHRISRKRKLDIEEDVVRGQVAMEHEMVRVPGPKARRFDRNTREEGPDHSHDHQEGGDASLYCGPDKCRKRRLEPLLINFHDPIKLVRRASPDRLFDVVDPRDTGGTPKRVLDVLLHADLVHDPCVVGRVRCDDLLTDDRDAPRLDGASINRPERPLADNDVRVDPDAGRRRQVAHIHCSFCSYPQTTRPPSRITFC